MWDLRHKITWISKEDNGFNKVELSKPVIFEGRIMKRDNLNTSNMNAFEISTVPSVCRTLSKLPFKKGDIIYDEYEKFVISGIKIQQNFWSKTPLYYDLKLESKG